VVASIRARYLTADALNGPAIGPGFAAGDEIWMEHDARSGRVIR